MNNYRANTTGVKKENINISEGPYSHPTPGRYHFLALCPACPHFLLIPVLIYFLCYHLKTWTHMNKTTCFCLFGNFLYVEFWVGFMFTKVICSLYHCYLFIFVLWYSIVWISHNLFTSSEVSEHSGSKFLATTDGTAVNTPAYFQGAEHTNFV